MGKESNCNLDGIDKDILKQMELKRREIIANISDLPPWECNINCVSKEYVRFLTHTVFYLIE